MTQEIKNNCYFCKNQENVEEMIKAGSKVCHNCKRTLTQEINISKILEEYRKVSGSLDKDCAFWKEKCIQLLDAITCERTRYVEHMKSKRAFDEGNGYDRHVQETKSIIEQLKK